MSSKRDVQTQIISSINRHFLGISAVLIVFFILSQFAVLATVGTKGAEIGKIRADKDALRIENEYLRSQIDEAKSLSQIEEGLYDIFELEHKDVDVIRSVSTLENQNNQALR